MPASLRTSAKVIGIKQSRKAIQDGQTKHVYIANDAEKRVIDPIVELCHEHSVKITWVESMQKLGEECEIDVGAAIVALKNFDI